MIATGMPAESMTVCNPPAVGGCSPSRYRSASNNDVAVLTPDSTVLTRRSRSGPGNPNSQMRGSIPRLHSTTWAWGRRAPCRIQERATSPALAGAPDLCFERPLRSAEESRSVRFGNMAVADDVAACTPSQSAVALGHRGQPRQLEQSVADL